MWYVIFDYPLKWSQQLIPWLAENVYGINEVTFIEMTGRHRLVLRPTVSLICAPTNLRNLH